MDEFNWIRQYNELFDFINQKDTEAYFSGPRFLGIIKEFDKTYPDYTQYIEYRKNKKLSTSRKNYFFDILSTFQEEIRTKIIERIYDVAKSKNNTNVKEEIKIDESIWGKANEIERQEPITSSEVIENLKVFISYSWDNEEHKTWILNFATRLRNNGIEIILDRYELQAGKSIPHFMEQALEKSDKVLVIFTENYKLKADGRNGGVGYEYSILNNDTYTDIANNSNYIPILKDGTFETSVPSFMQQFITIDMTDSSQYEEKIKEVTLALYGKPLIEKSVVGKKPDYI